ncbi:MAG: hypothetical protein ACTSQP_11030 [Promethearchaeota archaeon]
MLALRCPSCPSASRSWCTRPAPPPPPPCSKIPPNPYFPAVLPKPKTFLNINIYVINVLE